MSSDQNAIILKDVRKTYHIYERPKHRLLQFINGKRKTYYRNFDALKNINVTIPKGSSFGIIGRNGSGKSTLLQIVCGTLTPTEGEVTVNGRIAALLELGAGFNPEFTGLENIALAASLYGLSPAEIEVAMPSIEAFADIGDFIRQPVKFYSSGMYVRLAFAIIAHVKADILVIDEALAVGDAIFTQKCMDFIRTFKKTGTLLFVSHDNSAVLALCDQALWLNQGHVEKIGPAKEVTEAYLRFTLQQNYGDSAELKPVAIAKLDETAAPDATSGWQTGSGEITGISLTAADGSRPAFFEGGEQVKLSIKAQAKTALTSPIIGFMVRDRLGQDLFGENTLVLKDAETLSLQAGEEVEAHFTFTLPLLPNGDYGVLVAFAEGTQDSHIQHHWLSNAVIITIWSQKTRWGLVGLTCDSVTLQRAFS